MSMPGPFELLVIFLVVLLLFGGKRMPEIGRSLGQGIREFMDALKGNGKQPPKDKDSDR